MAEAIRKKLEFLKNELQKAYMMANEDEGQKEAGDEWEVTLIEEI